MERGSELRTEGTYELGAVDRLLQHKCTTAFANRYGSGREETKYMKVVQLNDKQRRKIVRLVKPRENDYASYQNLKLLTAVFDEDKRIYLTLAFYLSSSIRRTDARYDEYSYALLTRVGNYLVTCRKEAGEYRGIFSPMPLAVSKEKIRELIKYYEDSFSERYCMEKEAKKELDLAGKGFTEWYLEKYYFKTIRNM